MKRWTHGGVLSVADLRQVHPGDDAEPRSQALQQESNYSGSQKNPQELVWKTVKTNMF